MFTGIVEGTGTVRTAARRGDVMTVRIDVGGLFEGLPLGGSVAVTAAASPRCARTRRAST